MPCAIRPSVLLLAPSPYPAVAACATAGLLVNANIGLHSQAFAKGVAISAGPACHTLQDIVEARGCGSICTPSNAVEIALHLTSCTQQPYLQLDDRNAIRSSTCNVAKWAQQQSMILDVCMMTSNRCSDTEQAANPSIALSDLPWSHGASIHSAISASHSSPISPSQQNMQP